MAISAGGASGRLGGPALSARLYLDGEFWTLQAGGATLRLRDGKGLRHLADLASTPGTAWHALDLARSANTATSDDVAANAKPVEDRRAQPHAAPPAGLRERLRELDEELEEAEALHDIERAARARRELQRIERDVAQRIGAGDVGASEGAAASAERARVNVTRALRATLKRISGRAPELGRYLDLSVTTGMSCTFAPAHGFELQVGDAPAAPRLSAAAALAPAPAPDQAANRAGRTLVSIEVTSSADIAARLGETRWQDMLTRHDATVRAQANFFGGTAAPRNGDLTLLVFDAPDAATRCARAIVEGGRESGVVARAGVHHGECELLGDSVSGLAVHAAGRLAALAEPGQVLLSEDVQRQLAPGEIAVTDAGDHHELRGVPGEWHVYALARTAAAKPAATPAEKASEAPAALPLPPRLHALTEHALFGREVELDVVDTAVARAVGGTHPFIAIAGEPGIGKTRLAAEAAARAHQHGATVLHGRCDEDLAIPYQPIVEALSHYVDAATPLALGALRGGGPLARLLPQLATDSAPATGIYDSVSDGERYVLYSQVASLLASVPGTSLVLVVDDIQWADRETLLLLKFLLRAPAPARLALLTTYRSTDLDDGHPLAELLAGLAHDEAFTRIELQGLGQADILALTAQLAGEELPAPLLELSRALAGETRGNAFFTTEILRHLADSGDLARAASEWRAGRRRALPRLPGTVRETITHRIARLGADTRDLLSVAATIGGDFDLGLLAAAAGRDEDGVLDELDAAVAAGIVTMPDEDGRRYTFAHALVADTLYDDLPPGRRRKLHRQIAQELEQQLGPEPGARVSELAHHVLRGAYREDLAKARDYARRAGDHALNGLAPHEAVRWYERALDVANDVATSDEDRCELLIGLGSAENQSGGAFRETLLTAAELATKIGDADRLARAALANTRGFVSATGIVDGERVAVLERALDRVAGDDVRARLLALLAAELTFAGDWDRRLALADEALSLARETGDTATLSDVFAKRFITLWTPETLARRTEDAIEALALAELQGNLLTRLRALHWRAATLMECGDLQESARLVVAQTTLAQQLGQPTLLWLASYDRATQALAHGLLDEADACAQEAGRIAIESGQPDATAFLAGQLINIAFERGTLHDFEPVIAAQVAANPGIPAFEGALALARVEGGDDAGAREVLERDFDDLPYDSNWLVGITIFAEACGRARAQKAGADLHQRLEAYASHVAFNSATVWGLVERPLGLLARALGRDDEAEQRLRRAAAAHERMGAPLWLARTRLDLAELLGAGGEARTLAGLARATAEDLGAQGIARRATRVIEEISRV